MEQVRAREAEGSPASADVMNNVKDVQGSQVVSLLNHPQTRVV